MFDIAKSEAIAYAWHGDNTPIRKQVTTAQQNFQLSSALIQAKVTAQVINCKNTSQNLLVPE